MVCDSLCRSDAKLKQHSSESFIQQAKAFFSNILDTSQWPARWHCGNWSNFHGILYIIADLSIWAAYFTIPFLLFRILKKRSDLPFGRIFWLFITFIFLCGTTHLINALMFWWPAYRLSALVLLATGIVSIVTVFELVKLFPAILKLRTIEQLEVEIKEREKAETETRHLQLMKQASDELILKQDELMAQLTLLNKGLEQQTRELEKTNSELEQFAYVASHDLQEPLRMITSFMALLEKKYNDNIDDQGKLYIKFAVDGAKRMRNIILDLLEFSRAGKTEDKLELVNLNELIDGVIKFLGISVEEKMADIQYSNLPVIRTFKSPLQLTFQNLISNAVKYQPKGNIPIIQIRYEEMSDHWVFSVKDNGIGINAEFHQKIFIIFQRLHHKDTFAGTGMGLALTKKLIESMGGKIWLESAEGSGSIFYFTILKC